MVQSGDIFLFLLLVSYSVSLDVQITPSHGEISLGESKFFICEVVGVPKHIDWFGPKGDRIEPNRQDITVTRNDESSSTLTLYNAGEDNAGTYKCVAISGDQQAESTVNVKIFQRITFTNAPSRQEFTEGDNANLVCDVTSSPPPTVFWKYKGARIQMHKDVRFKVLPNNHLQIRGIKKTDEGAYTCEARQFARGEIDLRVIKVVVNVLPTIRVWQSEVNATAEVGNSAMLTCAPDGYPEPMVTWERNKVVLEAGEKYSFNEDGSEITIMDVSKLDEGEYTCIAKNKAGEAEQELSLRVFVKPKITYIVNQTSSEMEEQVTLTCEASGDPTPTISWSSSEHVFTEGDQASWTRPEQHKSPDGNVVVRSDARVSSLTLKYVKYTDAGQYTCTAQSAIGEDTSAAYLEVNYAPKIHGTVAVYTWEGNSVNMSCEVRAYPSEVSITWLRDGFQLPNSNSTNIKIFRTPSSSYLQITPESENDFGSYNCTASNDMGTESKEFLLIQADVPSAPAVSEVRPFSTTAQVQFEEPESNGGVPVLRYRAEWRAPGSGRWHHKVFEAQDGVVSDMIITGLSPETNYEVRLSAVNGKGEGESSSVEFFKTEPVRNPNPPKLEWAPQPKGNSLRVSWIKQDDGGSAILHYLIRYKPVQETQWKPEIRMPRGSDSVVLSGLEWDTEYNVFVVAENEKGKSQPASMSFRTTAEPAGVADLGEESVLNMNTILWAGIIVVVFILLLLAVDVTCYFVNKCGLIMCLCGKSGTGSKGHNLEEGKAAFIKDESKEPIVEVRTEDECTANHNAAGPTEPSETTPLTEPELAAYTAALALDTLSSTATATLDPALESPSSETTTLTCSLSTPANEPSHGPATAPIPCADSITAPPTPVYSSSDDAEKTEPPLKPGKTDKPSPLVLDQKENLIPVEQSKLNTPPSTPDQTKDPKAVTPIPPKRRFSPKLMAAQQARNSPPVSPLASSSPSASPILRKQAPSPPKPAPKDTVALDTTANTASRPAPAVPKQNDLSTAPDLTESSFTPFYNKKPYDQMAEYNNISITKNPQGNPNLNSKDTAPLAEDAHPTHNTSNDLFATRQDTYDLLAPESQRLTGLESPDIELELGDRTERPSSPTADLISLESPPSDPAIPNGDGADPSSSETVAKTAPPVSDEHFFSDEADKLEEAQLTNALAVITGHNTEDEKSGGANDPVILHKPQTTDS
uniref:Neural cell adhesion molecule 1b n=1 Tax=Knipowitschia caucasica TaxID=637954 RepID=A0AAV2J042_KNICA